MQYCVAILLALLSQVSIAATFAESQAQEIHSAIEKRGAKAVVNDLYESQNKWSALLEAVSSGAPEWLKVAQELSAGTDAGSTSMLQIAVTRALGNNTLETLKLMSDGTDNSTPVFSAVFVCSSNFLIDYPADKSALQFIDNTIGKLKEVNEPELIKVRDQCNIALQEARRDVVRIMGEKK